MVELDLYLLLTPIYGVLGVLTLVALKLTLMNLRYSTKTKLQSEDEALQDRQFGCTDMVTYMLKNMTLAELCFTNRSQNKLLQSFEIASISLLCYFLPSLYMYCFVGSIVSVSVLALEIALWQTKETVKPITSKSLFVILSFLTIFGHIAMCGLLFKNYANIHLEAMIINILTNYAISNLACKPVAYCVFGFFMSMFDKVELTVTYWSKAETETSVKREVGIAVKLSPKKKVGSPSKAPRVMEKIALEEDLYNKENNEEEAYIAAVELIKKVKKERKGLPSLLTPLSQKNNDEFSEDHLDNTESQIKGIKSPVGQIEFALDNTIISEQNEVKTESDAEPDYSHTKKFSTLGPNLILVNTGEEDEKEDESILGEEEISNNPQQSQYKQTTPKNINFTSREIEEEGKIKTLDKNEASRNAPTGTLKMTLNPSDMEEESVNDNFEIFDRRRKRMSMDKDDANPQLSHRNSILKMEDKSYDQIEEIDLNSPEKRRNLENIQEQSHGPIKLKKKKQKKSQARKRVIKFSSGEPYLEYLPNMLSKDDKNKKSQQIGINKKMVSHDNNKIQSMNRLGKKDPIVYENDENQIPQFFIDDL